MSGGAISFPLGKSGVEILLFELQVLEQGRHRPCPEENGFRKIGDVETADLKSGKEIVFRQGRTEAEI